jgi:hypothetical protein
VLDGIIDKIGIALGRKIIGLEVWKDIPVVGKVEEGSIELGLKEQTEEGIMVDDND